MGPNTTLLQEIKQSPLWPHYTKRIQEDYELAKEALVDAVDNDTVRLLQGRCISYRAVLTYPQYLATLAASEKDDIRG